MSVLEFGPLERPVDIVFCHATGFNGLTYRRTLAPLASELRLLVPDLRGHGGSTLPADPGGRADWCDLRDDLIALLDALGIEAAVLAGHSMGATVSLLAAAEAPRLARRLVLFDPVVFERDFSQPQPAERGAMAQAAGRRRAVFPSREAALAAYVGRGAFATWPRDMIADFVQGGMVDIAGGQVRLACDPAFEAAIYDFQGHDSRAAFAAVQAPIDIWRAQTGSTLRLEEYEAGLAARPNVSIKTVRQGSHFFPMEQPAVVQAALRAAVQASA